MGRNPSLIIIGDYNRNDIGIKKIKHQPEEIAIQIIEAREEDSGQLSNIAFDAKKHWPYPDEYFNIWKDELTILPFYIEHNLVFKAVIGNNIVGFYSLVYLPNDNYNDEVKLSKGWWLEHLFIHPKFHKLNIGSKLIKHCKSVMRNEGIKKISIFVDPYATGFYEKIGAKFIYNSPSSISGRELPVYTIDQILE